MSDFSKNHFFYYKLIVCGSLRINRGLLLYNWTLPEFRFFLNPPYSLMPFIHTYKHILIKQDNIGVTQINKSKTDWWMTLLRNITFWKSDLTSLTNDLWANQFRDSSVVFFDLLEYLLISHQNEERKWPLWDYGSFATGKCLFLQEPTILGMC